MNIETINKRVIYARESVIEFLLINHPLDCPICDQGGECDLQDITLIFGTDRGRFYDLKKRAIDNLNCGGPLIKTIMTRCIHCTRCIRFLNEICGVFNLGAIGRGVNMEIGTFIKETTFLSELSGNIIDLCPVGALTSMPYAFIARAWELEKFNTIDVLDALGASIRVDAVNNKIVRILPRLNEAVNEEWATNKSRFIYDSISIQRLYYPKIKYNLKFFVISWFYAFELFIWYLNKNIFDILESFNGQFIDLETAFSLKMFFNGIGCSNIFYQFPINYSIDLKYLYLLNITLENLEKINFLFLIGSNLRLEAPLILTRIRKAHQYYDNEFKIFSLGLALNNFYFYIKNIGNSTKSYKQFLEGKLGSLNSIFVDYLELNVLKVDLIINPIFLIGPSVLSRIDSWALIKSLLYIFPYLNIFNEALKNINFISTNLGILSGFEFNIFKYKTNLTNPTKFVYLIHADIKIYNMDDFIVYQGPFVNTSDIFYKARLLLPASVYLEKNCTYINLEGRYRNCQKTIYPSNFIFNDFEIIQGLNLIKINKIAHNFSIVRQFIEIVSIFQSIINYDCLFFITKWRFLNNIKSLSWFEGKIYDSMIKIYINFWMNLYSNCKFVNSIICQSINNYYQTDFFCKNSKIIALCGSKIVIKNFNYIKIC